MDLGLEKMLSGVMVQGGKHRDKNLFMKKFRVGHSLNGDEWAIVKEDNSTKPKVGPRSVKTSLFILFVPHVPITASPGKHGVRANKRLLT